LLPVALLGGLAKATATPPPAVDPLKAAASVPLLGKTSPDSLAGSLRGYLVRNLPATLYESSPGWGHTEKGFRGVKWKGKGLDVHPEVLRGPKNDGKWKKVRVSTVNLPDTLVFDLRNVHQPPQGPTTFDLFISFDARVDFTEQKWDAGVKLFDGSVRARLRVKLMLSCEVTAHAETTGGILPEVVFRLRVVRSSFQYDNFVVEHVAGVGGEAAKVLGDTVRSSLKKIHPSLEHDLLAKANAAVEKAGTTKEVHLGLGTLMKKEPAPTPKDR
jgi:hypothetical protein